MSVGELSVGELSVGEMSGYRVCISRDIHGLQLVLYESLQLASSNFTGNCHNGKLVKFVMLFVLLFK